MVTVKISSFSLRNDRALIKNAPDTPPIVCSFRERDKLLTMMTDTGSARPAFDGRVRHCDCSVASRYISDTEYTWCHL